MLKQQIKFCPKTIKTPYSSNRFKPIFNLGNFLLLLLFFVSSLLTAQEVSQQLNFDAKEVKTSKSDRFDVIELENAGLLQGEENAGSPQLPVTTFKFLLPKGANVSDVSIASAKETRIPGKFDIAPVQLPHYPNFDDPPAIVGPNQEIYKSSKVFPQKNMLDFATNGYRDYTYVSVSFIPFKYIPSEQELYLMTDIEFNIRYTVNAAPSTHKLRPFSGTDERAYQQMKKMVINPDQLSKLYPMESGKVKGSTRSSGTIGPSLPSTSLPSLEGGEVKYVIITNNTDINGNPVGNFTTRFQEFADWKTQSGSPAKVVTVDAIRNAYPGVDIPEKIRNFVKEAHQLWGTEYVLLGGGAPIIPVRWIKHYFDMPTDLYYSAIYHPTMGYDDNWNADGDDIFGENYNNNSGPDYSDYNADIAVGRAPVETNAELDVFLKKNFTYARCSFAQNIPNGTYLGKQLMGYGSAFDTGWNSGNAMKVGYEIIQNHHQDLDIYGMFEYHAPRNLPCNDSESWAPAYYPLHGNCTTNLVPIDDEDLLKDDFINQINTGYGMINILEHGGPYGLGLGKVTQATPIIPTDFQNLADTRKYGVLLAGGCHSAAIERDFYIGEQWVNAPGGGVAYMGASADIFASSSYNFNREYFDVLHDDNVHKLGVAPGITSMNLNATYLTKIMQVLGDPDLSIYTDVPTNMTVTHASSIPVGNQNFNVNVTNFPSGELVKVCLYKENEVLAYVETSSFPVTFDITPDTEGLMRVTATCHNKEPYEADVTVGPYLGTHLYISSMNVIDENQNGFVEPGETVNLEIKVNNTGAVNATNISSTLTSSDLNTVISQANSGYPNIASGQSAYNIVNFTFTASTEAYPGNVIPFELVINASQGAFTEPFILNTRSPQLQMGNRSTLVNGVETNSFNANDVVSVYIDIKNIGNVLADNVTAVLATNLPASIASVSTGNSTYGDIGLLETKTNATPFIVNIGNAYNAENLVFELTLTDELGKTDVFEFSLNEDLPPKIDGFDYTSSSNFITPTWNAISNISGYNIFRSNTQTSGYVQLNDQMITSAAMYNDLEVLPLTGYWYKVSVVTLSGNELPVTSLDPYYANTTLGYHGGFPIQSHPLGQLKTIASPTVIDIDSDGDKEIFLNLRTNSTSAGIQGRILGFYESGQELFDIDGNQTDVRGFAETVEPLYANSAIGDIDNDGHAEVFAIARTPSILFGYSTEDSNNNQQPDPLWNNGQITIGHRTYRNPVLSDLNNNGYMEIIILDERQTVYVYDHNKNLLGSKQIGNEDYSEGELAIVDTDGNGYKEIIISCEKVNGHGAIYNWKHNGNFSTDPILLREFTGRRADSGPVLADIDNDGQYEILTIVKDGTTGYVYALNIEDGSDVNSNWAGATSILLPNAQYQGHIIPRMAVGDLDDDGDVEVVFGSQNNLYVLNHVGNMVAGFPKPISNSWDVAPILADIDFDDDVEIIINESGELHAYDYNGTPCFGWPLVTTNGSPFVGSPFIGDIDSDGMNEIVIGSEDYTAYVWDTPGDSDKVEWESYRGNPQNTGVYEEECKFSSAETVVIYGFADVAWAEDKHIQGNLIIKANAQLTIQSRVTFTQYSQVIVEPGGKLVLDGATLTTDCSDFWPGIKVYGNSSVSQTAANQGTLVTKKKSQIEYAQVAIFAGKPSKSFPANPSGGAILNIESMTFKDNIVAIEMPNYGYSNSSYIKDNLFETTDYIINKDKNPDTFIKFGDVGIIKVDGNTFKNHKEIDPYTTPTILANQGNGIIGTGSELSIISNTFENLNTAIEFIGAKKSVKKPFNQIVKNTFNDNYLGVKLTNIGFVEVTSNDVNVLGTYLDGDGIGNSSGLHITNSNGFHIEANDFSAPPSYISNGIFIKDCKAKNEIYRNWFSDLHFGIFAQGTNRTTSAADEGLEFICNDFSKNKTDIYVADKSVISKTQGSEELPAGNVFYPECSGSINQFNNQYELVYYFAEKEEPYIPFCNTNLDITLVAQHHKCPSKLKSLDLVGSDELIDEKLEVEMSQSKAKIVEEESGDLNVKLEVSPNPARDFFIVKCPLEYVNNPEVKLQVINSIGVVIKTMKVDREMMEISSDTWKGGVYLVTMTNSQGLVATAKVVIN